MTLLLLAGTGEARIIAQELAEKNHDAVASLSGATRDPHTLAIPTRSGGFGGECNFRTYLQQQNITAILDATHPFAAQISARACRVAGEMSLPYLQVLREPWVPQPADNWTMISSESQAADHIPQGAVVFLATGRQSLPKFGNLTGRKLICRQIDPSDRPFPFENGEFLLGRPPFSTADEVSLFTKLGVDWIIVKNAGGQAAFTKLLAARQLRIPVLMIDRPDQPKSQKVQTAEQAMDWVRALNG